MLSDCSVCLSVCDVCLSVTPQLLPAALEVAVSEEPELRAGIPLDMLDYTGVVHSDSVS